VDRDFFQDKLSKVGKLICLLKACQAQIRIGSEINNKVRSGSTKLGITQDYPTHNVFLLGIYTKMPLGTQWRRKYESHQYPAAAGNEPWKLRKIEKLPS
jgi:hypothetical protein